MSLELFYWFDELINILKQWIFEFLKKSTWNAAV